MSTQNLISIRLPKTLLDALDSWCSENDYSRAQFVRHSISEKLKSLAKQKQGGETPPQQQQPQSYNSKVQQRQQQPQWSQESYDRLVRR